MNAPRKCFLAAVLPLALLLLLPPPARAVDLVDQLERVGREIERTDELLQRVGGEARDSDLPRPTELLRLAVENQAQAKVAHSRAQAEAPTRPLVAASILKNSLGLTLRARDLGLQAGRMLREQQGQAERARRLIERGREGLARLREHAREGDSPALRQLAERVAGQLSQAEDQYRDGNPEIAGRLAESALQLMANLRDLEARGGPGRVGAELERVGRLLARAQDRAGELDERGRERLHRCEELLAQARRALADGQPRQARRLGQDCQRLLRQLAADRGGEGIDATRVRQAMEDFDEELAALLDRAGDELPPRVDRQLATARQHRADAGRALEEGRPQPALRQLRVATELLARVARELDGRRR